MVYDWFNRQSEAAPTPPPADADASAQEPQQDAAAREARLESLRRFSRRKMGLGAKTAGERTATLPTESFKYGILTKMAESLLIEVDI